MNRKELIGGTHIMRARLMEAMECSRCKSNEFHHQNRILPRFETDMRRIFRIDCEFAFGRCTCLHSCTGKRQIDRSEEKYRQGGIIYYVKS